MTEYYDNLDMAEEKRIIDHAKQRLGELKEHGGKVFQDFLIKHDLNGQEQNEDWEKKAHEACMKLLKEELVKKQEARMPFVIVPDQPLNLDITDKENNCVYRLFVYADQSDDAIKALRRKGYTARVFSYDKNSWEAENKERNILKEQVTNLTVTLMRSATASFQQLFTALMHLKVMRAYIDGVLRFGIPPKFYIGIVIPKKGAERSILNDMTGVLAEKSLMEMYGEKVDANEAEDYWPFVCVNLTSPNFMHSTKE